MGIDKNAELKLIRSTNNKILIFSVSERKKLNDIEQESLDTHWFGAKIILIPWIKIFPVFQTNYKHLSRAVYKYLEELTSVLIDL